MTPSHLELLQRAEAALYVAQIYVSTFNSDVFEPDTQLANAKIVRSTHAAIVAAIAEATSKATA